MKEEKVKKKADTEEEFEKNKEENEPIKQKNEKEEEKGDYFKKSTKKGIYIGYEIRVMTYIILILLCLIAIVFVFNKAFSSKNPEYVTYQENSNVDYKVFLKKNEFYETEYLGKDMIYVASLINKIDVDFNYIFGIDKPSDIIFDYNIIGKLVITDNEGKNTFFEKEYTLLKTINEDINVQKNHRINKKVSINYGYYNNLANKFRANYGVDTNSNLIVTLNIRERGKKHNIKNSNNMSLTIPLSEKAINIKMDYKEINSKSQIAVDKDFSINSYMYLAIGVLIIAITIILLILLTQLILKGKPKKSVYDKYIKKILNEYDRLIVETKTAPDLNNEKITNVDSFDELLDVRDNISLPIKFYEVHKHQKCNFYINHNEEMYLLTIKAVDLEKSEK